MNYEIAITSLQLFKKGLVTFINLKNNYCYCYVIINSCNKNKIG